MEDQAIKSKDDEESSSEEESPTKPQQTILTKIKEKQLRDLMRKKEEVRSVPPRQYNGRRPTKKELELEELMQSYREKEEKLKIKKQKLKEKSKLLKEKEQIYNKQEIENRLKRLDKLDIHREANEPVLQELHRLNEVIPRLVKARSASGKPIWRKMIDDSYNE